MTIPWWLNPWAEVRRLRGKLKWRDQMRRDIGQAYRDERAEKFSIARKYSALRIENVELKRQIAEQSDAAQAALCRVASEKDAVIQSWAQRYVALCSINAMLEQKNARLEGDTDYPLGAARPQDWSKI